MLLAKKHPAEAPATLEDQYMLDLTMYEVCNAIWKICKLIEKSGKSAALEAVEQAHSLTALMKVVKVESLEGLRGTMNEAIDGNLSFYDSAYLYTARAMKLTLVTEDERLLRRTRAAGVDGVKVNDLVQGSDV